MTWMRVMLTRNDIKTGKHIQLQDAFEKVFMATLAPKDAVMFENDPSYDEYGYYFSPEAVAVFSAALASYNAVECGPPPRSETTLLVGHADALDMLSPDAKNDGT